VSDAGNDKGGHTRGNGYLAHNENLGDPIASATDEREC